MKHPMLTNTNKIIWRLNDFIYKLCFFTLAV